MTSRNDPPDSTAEVLRLSFVEGMPVRAISRQLSMSRKTVRRILGRGLPRKGVTERRSSLLTPYENALVTMLKQTPELKAPTVLERLRVLGYQGGVSILRDRMRMLRPTFQREAF